MSCATSLIVDNNECHIQAMRRRAVESGARYVKVLIDAQLLPQGRVLDLAEGKEGKEDEGLRLARCVKNEKQNLRL